MGKYWIRRDDLLDKRNDSHMWRIRDKNKEMAILSVKNIITIIY